MKDRKKEYKKPELRSIKADISPVMAKKAACGSSSAHIFPPWSKSKVA